MADAETTDTDRIHCPGRGCSKTFSKKSGGLAKHLKRCKHSHNQQPVTELNYIKEGNLWKCTKCVSTFTKPQNFYKHFKIYHIEGKEKTVKGKKSFPCTVCSKPFPKQCLLFRHELTHTKAKHECGKCGKQYVRSDHFESHERMCNQTPSSGNSSMDDSAAASWMEDLPTMIESYPEEGLIDDEPESDSDSASDADTTITTCLMLR